MVCGFCATGCGLNVHLKEGRAINLSPSTHYPVNLGMACPKGWEALAPLESDARATLPLLRRNGKFESSSWHAAIGEMVSRFKAIQARHGNASIAWIGTGQLPTEELAFLGALGKFGMGMVHGDGNTRQCMATAAVAYKECFGYDAPPYTYADFEQSDVIVLIGSNLCIAHPILWERICRNRNQPKIIVIDPRSTETALAATRHFAIPPKSDLMLFYGVARELIERNALDRRFIDDHTEGFDAYAAHVASFTPERVAAETGLPEAYVTELADLIGSGKRVSFWWTMGVNQSHEGVRVAESIIALALMTGNIGRPGTGANSITGQCNAMGSRLFSNTTCLFGGRDFRNPEHRAEVAEILGIDMARIPSEPSWAYDRIIDGIETDQIKALWIVGTNPAHSWIDQQRLLRLLPKLECLVVQDMYTDTDTAQHADILLPAAGWGEKEGTFVNSERRIGVIKKVRLAPGEALADFHIFSLVAEAWGCGELFESWDTPEAVFHLLRELSRGTPCDFGAITGYTHLDAQGGIQWPHDAPGDPEGERRLFQDGRFFTKNERARFIAGAPRPMPEAPSPEYPFLLLTGRGSSAQWHTQTRTKRSKVLATLAPSQPYVEVSPEDARKLGIRTGQRLRICSRRGRFEATAHVTATVKPGQLFIPMHYAAMNRLTFGAFDPESRQPSYKACAVRLEPHLENVSETST
jgi:assimilatory nitrate reductase catalytic subunit